MHRTNDMKKGQIDEKELQEKIDEYGDMLFRLSYMRLQNTQDAEDVVQEVFYRYLMYDGEFESREHERAWLLKVALNACRKLWRSAWRRYHSDGDWTEECGVTAAEAEGTVPEPETAAFRQEERRRLLAAVMALPAKYREVIHLFYYEEFSVKEIARVTGRGESTVTSQLTRGRELLKKSLKEEYDFG